LFLNGLLAKLIQRANDNKIKLGEIHCTMDYNYMCNLQTITFCKIKDLILEPETINFIW